MKKQDTLNDLFDFITDRGIATRNEIILVTKINGWNADSLNDIIYTRTGYRSADQLEECEG